MSYSNETIEKYLKNQDLLHLDISNDEEQKIKDLSKINLKEAVFEIFKLSYYYDTLDSNKLLQCKRSRNRSFGDIYLMCNYYFEINVPTLKDILISLYSEDHSIYTISCNDINRKVFKTCYSAKKDCCVEELEDGRVACTCGGLDYADEYGNMWPDEKLKEDFDLLIGYSGRGPIPKLNLDEYV